MMTTTRRDFLKASSAGLLLAGVPVGLAAAAAAPSPGLTGESLELGLWHPATSPERVLPAVSLPRGDEALREPGVRVSIRGVYPKRALAGIRALALEVIYAASPAEPFIAWVHEPRNEGKATTFTVPLNETGVLAMQLRLRDAAGERVMPVQLTLTEERGAAKLQAGQYMLALPASRPNWGACRMEPSAGKRAVPTLCKADATPVDFAHIVFTVEAA